MRESAFPRLSQPASPALSLPQEAPGAPQDEAGRATAGPHLTWLLPLASSSSKPTPPGLPTTPTQPLPICFFIALVCKCR